MTGGKHTPGPWFLEGHWDVKSKFDLGGWVSSNPPAGCPIFQLEPSVGTAEEIVANARLIAAAPDLLAALHEGRRAIGDHFAPNDCYATGPLTGNHYRDLVECPACSFIAIYEAAIAKAEGGAA